jgi:hypothetical protein
MPFPTPKLETIKSRYLLGWLELEAEEGHRLESWEFYVDSAGNQKLYETYIKVGSPKQVNISADMRKPLEGLAAAKKWSSMSTSLKAAKKEVRDLIQRNTVEPFVRTPLGQRVLGVVQLGLDGPKAKQAFGLLQLYAKPRSDQDKYDAYVALQKLASKSKVDAVLTGLGYEPMAKPPTDKAAVERNVKLDNLAKDFRKVMPGVLSYFTSALSSIKKNGLPLDPEEVTRMFESGRLRHDKIHEPYTKAIRVDKAFSTKYKDVAELKKQIDDAWGEYRQALEKR